MRPISRRLFKLLNSDEFQPIELMDIQLVGQINWDVIHLTNAGSAITWNNQTYLPINFNRGQLEERMASTAGEVPSVTITVTNVDRRMAALLASAEIENAQVTLRLADRRLLANPRDALIITQGEARDFTLSDEILTFSIVNILGQMERINIPRRNYQNKCSYIFGDPGSCGAVVPTCNSYCLPGSTRKYIVVGPDVLAFAGTDSPADFFVGGYLGFMDGDNGLQFREIASVETFNGETRIYVRVQFLSLPNAGDPIRIRRMCKKTKADCAIFHGNYTSFGGYDVPPVQFRPSTVDHAQAPDNQPLPGWNTAE